MKKLGRQRAKAYLRRAKALENLDLRDKALAEYEAAAKAVPYDETVRIELRNAQQCLEILQRTKKEEKSST